MNLTYGLRAQLSDARSLGQRRAGSWRDEVVAEWAYQLRKDSSVKLFDHQERRALENAQWKRNLSERPNGTIDSWYGCDIFDEMCDYAVNFTFPWCKGVYTTSHTCH